MDLSDLRAALLQGDKSRIQSLLERQEVVSQLNSSPAETHEMLSEAIKKGKGETVLPLLTSYGLSVTGTDSSGKTLLHDAAIVGDSLVTIRLLGTASLVNTADSKKNTPLHYAAFLGHSEIAVHLIQHGADVDLKADQNWTPLHRAAKSGATRVVMSLLSAGAKTDVQLKDGAGDDSGKTAAEVAHSNGFPHIAKMIDNFVKEKRSGSSKNPLKNLLQKAGSEPIMDTHTSSSVDIDRDELSLIRKRVLRLEDQRAKVTELRNVTTQTRKEWEEVTATVYKRLDDLTHQFSLVAPDHDLHGQRETWKHVLERVVHLETEVDSLQKRVQVTETRMRYLEYVMVAIAVYLIFFS